MPSKFYFIMEKKLVDVLFDRRKLIEKRGWGYLEVRVNLGHKVRRYITICTATKEDWEEKAQSEEAKAMIRKFEGILTAMSVLGEESNIENFNFHYTGEMKKPLGIAKKESETPDLSKKSFIRYMELALEDEELSIGTYKHKKVVIDAVKRSGKLNTYADLTPAGIMAFDKWLHDGTRTDITCTGYHKKVHKWVRQLYDSEEIPSDPYKRVKLKKGKSKERTPLTEGELKRMREHNFSGKLEKVRDLFVFAAYTGLSYVDTQNFEFENMTIVKNGMYYVDGSRIKTGSRFFTPILSPAMEVLEKYGYELPKISNQKANDYLHVIEAQLGFIHNLTFHVARHTFATLALSHDVPIENVARMLGHQDIKTTQIYAKVLRSTIERHAEALQGALL